MKLLIKYPDALELAVIYFIHVASNYLLDALKFRNLMDSYSRNFEM